MPAPLDPLVKAQRELERIKIDNANLRSLNKKLLNRSGGYDEFLEQLKLVLKAEKDFKYKPASVKLTEGFDKKHEEVACVAMSDLHLTETVRVDDCNGINIYNSMIASNRLWEHCQSVISILKRHQAMYSIKEIELLILGDMVSGSIHPEFLTTNDLTDMGAVVLCERLITMFIQELKRLGIKIKVDTVVGNHPRTTIKVPTKKIALTNLDWVIYETMADKFSKDSQVSVTNHTSQIGVVDVLGWRYVIEHGISIPNGGEEKNEDNIRALFDDPTYRKATGLTGSSFDAIVFGNLHKPKFLERTIVNGSYVGQNELGNNWRLKPIKAIQNMWGVSKDRVRTFQYQVDLTDTISQKAENPMSEYTQWFLNRYGKL